MVAICLVCHLFHDLWLFNPVTELALSKPRKKYCHGPYKFRQTTMSSHYMVEDSLVEEKVKFKKHHLNRKYHFETS